jgi:hypothetical protein
MTDHLPMTGLEDSKVLEAMVERYGFRGVLDALAAICDDKANRIAVEEQNAWHAKAWVRVGQSIRFIKYTFDDESL